jgi:diguanylate cyclase (GGDEF)-like protein
MPKRFAPPAHERKTRSAQPPAPRGVRRVRGDDAEPVSLPRRPARVLAMQLAAEVERLEAELAAARARMAELERCAEIDPLTEVLNRRGIDRELKRALGYIGRYGGGAALVYLDLDRFKPINDRHGHATGDRVLRAVAAALQRNVRESDAVGRIGGDEFVVLIWNLSEAQALAKAAALEGAVASTIVEHADLDLSVGASAGIAMLDPSADAAALLERADAAMYARKAARQAKD